MIKTPTRRNARFLDIFIGVLPFGQNSTLGHWKSQAENLPLQICQIAAASCQTVRDSHNRLIITAGHPSHSTKQGSFHSPLVSMNGVVFLRSDLAPGAARPNVQ